MGEIPKYYLYEVQTFIQKARELGLNYNPQRDFFCVDGLPLSIDTHGPYQSAHVVGDVVTDKEVAEERFKHMGKFNTSNRYISTVGVDGKLYLAPFEPRLLMKLINGGFKMNEEVEIPLEAVGSFADDESQQKWQEYLNKRL